MSVIENYVVPIFVGFLLFGGLAWVIYLCYLFLTRTELFSHLKYRKLKKKFGDLEFNEKIVDFCEKAKVRGWKYRHVKLFAKGNKKGDEILYTFIVINKLMKGGQYDEKRINQIKSKVRKDESFFNF